MFDSSRLPFTAYQEELGHLNIEGASNLAILHDLCISTNTHKLTNSAAQDANISNIICSLLALILDDDDQLAQVFPDRLLEQYKYPDGHHLCGLRQDENGHWQRVADDDASLQERRDFIKHRFLLNTAHKLNSIFDHVDRAKLAADSRFHDFYRLVTITDLICNSHCSNAS